MFNPPENWRLLPQKNDSHLKISFIAPEGNYPPSINLAFEPTDLPLRTYLNLIKARTNNQLNKSYRDLGSIKTKAGNGHLIQIETKTSHGIYRILQSFVPVEGGYHLLTSAVHEKQFTKYFPEIKAAFESFDVLTELIHNNDSLNLKIQTLKESKISPKKKLRKLEKTLRQQCNANGIYWQLLVLKAFQEQILP